MDINRRLFLRNSALGMATLLLPMGSPRTAGAVSAANRTLVVLFLRGGADGLNLVVPRGDETHYLALRRDGSTGQDISLPPAPAALQLDGFFELHPALAPLAPLYRSGELAFLHGIGGTGDYSHFSAQDAMERAEPVNPTSVSDGWLQRTLLALEGQNQLDAPVLALSGVGIGPREPKALAGPAFGRSLAVPSLRKFRVGGAFAGTRAARLEQIYARTSGPLGNAGSASFSAIEALSELSTQPPGALYPSGDQRLNLALQDAARLAKNPALGVKAIAIDYGGWDHHADQLASMDRVGGNLATALAAFHEDLGGAASNTLTLVMTEFGRTAAVNGGGGTDHGWGTVMLALGGGIAGGRVLCREDPKAPSLGMPTPSGHWPGLATDELHIQPSSGEARDLKATIDYRDAFAEVLQRFLGLPEATVRDSVLRGYPARLPGLFV